uniref:EGF-like domain-containing protein n=1 Tax=Parascaris equorum TaxID=6256 RepID=A0A914RIW8_PAREQ
MLCLSRITGIQFVAPKTLIIFAKIRSRRLYEDRGVIFQMWMNASPALIIAILHRNFVTTLLVASNVIAAMGQYMEKDGVCVPLSNCDNKLECGVNAFCVKRPSRKNPSHLVPQCVCQDGYYGEDPSKFCDPVPDCQLDSQCPANARCVEKQARDRSGRATFTCVCDNGYRKMFIQNCLMLIGPNNVTCKTPSCADMKKPCHPDAKCIDLPNGGYACACRDGFRGVGTAELGCEPIDICNEYSPCSQYASCVNEPRGSYTCTCKIGYEGNGTLCRVFVLLF